MTVESTSVTGRSTVFTIDTNGDVTVVKPGRSPSCAGSGPSGCALFSYSGTTPHLLTMVADPRWDQTTTSGSGDRRFEVGLTGTAPNETPTLIKDRSTGGAGGTPILRVLTYDTAGSEVPAGAD